MPRKARVEVGPQCEGCAHGKRKALDHAIATGGTVRDIANRFGLSKSAVQRHKKHVQVAANKAVMTIVSAAGDYEKGVQSGTARAILGRIRDADRALDGAEEDRDWGAMVRALSEVRSIWMDVAKLTGELRPETSINVLLQLPEWQAIEARFVLMQQARPELTPELLWIAKGEGPMP